MRKEIVAKQKKIVLVQAVLLCSSHSCSSGSSCCDNNIFSDLEDFSKIKVITMKAVDNFS